MIVGHRGFPQKFPENSIDGLSAALQLGAEGVELDVQFSRDGTPVVIHDESVDRVSAASGVVMDMSTDQLKRISVHEPLRFGERYYPCYIPTLQTVCETLARSFYDFRIFIEIKAEAFAKFERHDIVSRVLEASKALAAQRVIISFDNLVLEQAREQTNSEIGWVLSDISEESISRARALSPDYLIGNYKLFSATKKIFHGSWQWFLYDIVDAELAMSWMQAGVKYIETWDTEKLIKAL